ncbi:MAG: DUF1737 domain-containing protein [Devosiaceae bacterium]|nr:DUF1737 domain-containing protein [Devosiaceae bacterium MH13]
MKLYRLLTGPDEGDSFCRKVTRALNDGWTLYGSPTLSFDAATGKTMCAQAVVTEQAGTYSEDEPLSKQSGGDNPLGLGTL